MQTAYQQQPNIKKDCEVLYPPHEIIKKRRLSLNLSQDQVAALCEISTAQYRRYESGARSIYSASFQMGVKLCYYLEINLNDLFSFEVD